MSDGLAWNENIPDWFSKDDFKPISFIAMFLKLSLYVKAEWLRNWKFSFCLFKVFSFYRISSFDTFKINPKKSFIEVLECDAIFE